MEYQWPYENEYGQTETVEADVLVLGGGLAGCFAAISAARKGKKVILVEKGATKRSGSAGTGFDHWESACTNPCSEVTAKEIAEALKNCKAVAILDRCESYNGNGGPLGSEVTAGLFRHKVMIEAVNYIYGLAGRDFTVSDAVHVFEELADAVENGKEVEQFQYIRLR